MAELPLGWCFSTMVNWACSETSAPFPGPFLGFAQVFSVLILKTPPEWAPTKTQLHVLPIIDRHSVMCVGTTMIHLLSIKSSLPSMSLTINYSRPSTASLVPRPHPARWDLGTRLLYRFSVLQATKSWVGPGNDASETSQRIMYVQLQTFVVQKSVNLSKLPLK